MKMKLLTMAVVAAITVNAHADSDHHGAFKFEPLTQSASGADWNPAAPWQLPAGYGQHRVAGEQALNLYDQGRDDWHDMNTVNETGRKAGRYLYRTHEVRDQAEGGAVSVVDLKTGEARLLAQDPSWDALDGIEWTPWGSLLIAEEVDNGRLLEVELDPRDPMRVAAIHDRPAVGRLAHEGIQVGGDGAVYVVDEFRGQSSGYGGGIYKFVPAGYGDLSQGRLYALKVTGADGVGQGEWVGPIDPATARESGTAAGGTGYQRPEDLQVIGDTLYVAVTEGLGYGGRVLAVDLGTLAVTNFIKPGVNVGVEAAGSTGFAKPDNLAVMPDGRLMVVEDNVPSDIWVAGRDRNQDGYADTVALFASLSDPEAEGTGIYFGKDPDTLLVNVQHSAAVDGDATWAISRLRGEERHDRDGDKHGEK